MTVRDLIKYLKDNCVQDSKVKFRVLDIDCKGVRDFESAYTDENTTIIEVE